MTYTKVFLKVGTVFEETFSESTLFFVLMLQRKRTNKVNQSIGKFKVSSNVTK